MVRRLIICVLIAGAAVAHGSSAPARAGTRPPSGNPFLGARLYVDPASDAARQAAAWSRSRPADAAALRRMAAQPVDDWLGGWLPDVSGYVRWYIRTKLAPTGSEGFFAVYNLPRRDCSGQFSAGGVQTAAQYRAWIDRVASAIGSYPVVMVIEPDGLPDAGCLPTGQRRERYALEAYAVRRFAALGHTAVYLDAGRSDWQPWPAMVAALRAADVADARGFSLDVTGYATTAHELAYGDKIARALGGKHFIVNTSRNGRGPWRPRVRSFVNSWCNERGRALGPAPTTDTHDRFADAFEWILHPGYSDGPCNGGGPAGTWWPAYAVELARDAGY